MIGINITGALQLFGFEGMSYATNVDGASHLFGLGGFIRYNQYNPCSPCGIIILYYAISY